MKNLKFLLVGLMILLTGACATNNIDSYAELEEGENIYFGRIIYVASNNISQDESSLKQIGLSSVDPAKIEKRLGSKLTICFATVEDTSAVCRELNTRNLSPKKVVKSSNDNFSESGSLFSFRSDIDDVKLKGIALNSGSSLTAFVMNAKLVKAKQKNNNLVYLGDIVLMVKRDINGRYKPIISVLDRSQYTIPQFCEASEVNGKCSATQMRFDFQNLEIRTVRKKAKTPRYILVPVYSY